MSEQSTQSDSGSDLSNLPELSREPPSAPETTTTLSTEQAGEHSPPLKPLYEDDHSDLDGEPSTSTDVQQSRPSHSLVRPVSVTASSSLQNVRTGGDQACGEPLLEPHTFVPERPGNTSYVEPARVRSPSLIKMLYEGDPSSRGDDPIWDGAIEVPYSPPEHYIAQQSGLATPIQQVVEASPSSIEVPYESSLSSREETRTMDEAFDASVFDSDAYVWQPTRPAADVEQLRERSQSRTGSVSSAGASPLLENGIADETYIVPPLHSNVLALQQTGMASDVPAHAYTRDESLCAPLLHPDQLRPRNTSPEADIQQTDRPSQSQLEFVSEGGPSSIVDNRTGGAIVPYGHEDDHTIHEADRRPLFTPALFTPRGSETTSNLQHFSRPSQLTVMVPLKGGPPSSEDSANGDEAPSASPSEAVEAIRQETDPAAGAPQAGESSQSHIEVYSECGPSSYEDNRTGHASDTSFLHSELSVPQQTETITDEDANTGDEASGTPLRSPAPFILQHMDTTFDVLQTGGSSHLPVSAPLEGNSSSFEDKLAGNEASDPPLPRSDPSVPEEIMPVDAQQAGRNSFNSIKPLYESSPSAPDGAVASGGPLPEPDQPITQQNSIPDDLQWEGESNLLPSEVLSRGDPYPIDGHQDGEGVPGGDPASERDLSFSQQASTTPDAHVADEHPVSLTPGIRYGSLPPDDSRELSEGHESSDLLLLKPLQPVALQVEDTRHSVVTVEIARVQEYQEHDGPVVLVILKIRSYAPRLGQRFRGLRLKMRLYDPMEHASAGRPASLRWGVAREPDRRLVPIIAIAPEATTFDLNVSVPSTPVADPGVGSAQEQAKTADASVKGNFTDPAFKTEVLWTIEENSSRKEGIPPVFEVAAVVKGERCFLISLQLTGSTAQRALLGGRSKVVSEVTFAKIDIEQWTETTVPSEPWKKAFERITGEIQSI